MNQSLSSIAVWPDSHSPEFARFDHRHPTDLQRRPADSLIGGLTTPDWHIAVVAASPIRVIKLPAWTDRPTNPPSWANSRARRPVSVIRLSFVNAEVAGPIAPDDVDDRAP